MGAGLSEEEHELAANGIITYVSATSEPAATQKPIKVVRIGRNIHAREHSKRWALSHSPSPNKARALGTHYTSHHRVAFRRSALLASEGNRFISNDEL